MTASVRSDVPRPGRGDRRSGDSPTNEVDHGELVQDFEFECVSAVPLHSGLELKDYGQLTSAHGWRRLPEKAKEHGSQKEKAQDWKLYGNSFTTVARQKGKHTNMTQRREDWTLRGILATALAVDTVVGARPREVSPAAQRREREATYSIRHSRW